MKYVFSTIFTHSEPCTPRGRRPGGVGLDRPLLATRRAGQRGPGVLLVKLRGANAPSSSPPREFESLRDPLAELVFCTEFATLGPTMMRFIVICLNFSRRRSASAPPILKFFLVSSAVLRLRLLLLRHCHLDRERAVRVRRVRLEVDVAPLSHARDVVLRSLQLELLQELDARQVLDALLQRDVLRLKPDRSLLACRAPSGRCASTRSSRGTCPTSRSSPGLLREEPPPCHDLLHHRPVPAAVPSPCSACSATRAHRLPLRLCWLSLIFITGWPSSSSSSSSSSSTLSRVDQERKSSERMIWEMIIHEIMNSAARSPSPPSSSA